MNTTKIHNHNGIYFGLLIQLVLSIVIALIHTCLIITFISENLFFSIVGGFLVGASLLLYFTTWIASKKYLESGTRITFNLLTLLLILWATTFLSYFLYTGYILIFNNINFRLIMLVGIQFFIVIKVFKETFTFVKKLKSEFDRLKLLEKYF